MLTNLELRDAALAAADLIAELDRLGIHVERVALGQHGTDINLQVGSAFDRTVAAAAFGLLNVSEPYGITVASVSNTGTVTHDLGEFRVGVYGPISDRTAVTA